MNRIVAVLLLCLVVFPGFALAQSHTESAPPSIDGHPDLNGTWWSDGLGFIKTWKDGDSVCAYGCDSHQGTEPAVQLTPEQIEAMKPDRPVYRPEFHAKVQDLHDRQLYADPVIRCLSPGVPRIGPPDKVVHTPGQVVFLYDDVSGNFFRIIPTDGRPHRDDIEDTYLGDSVGHWEGETLVINTVNFNEVSWLTDDGSFHTASLRVEERISRDGDELHWQATAFDPEVLAEPWQLRPRVAALTDFEMVEAPPCIEQDLDHMVDDTHHDNPR
jgi:hypothetical protein